MFDLLTRIPTSQQIRELEALWIKECSNYWGSVLMELAGAQASEYALSLLDTAYHDGSEQVENIVVIAGRGNNGGDGLVVARHLFLSGFDVSVYIVGDNNEAEMISPESKVNLNILKTLEIEINVLNEKNLDKLQEAIENSSLVIDGLLGTGLDRNVEGINAKAIDVINASDKLVLSLDIPSGINSDTGQVMGSAVQASATATFGYMKAGLLIYPGFEMAGEIKLFNIALPYIGTLPESFIQNSKVDLSLPKWWLVDEELIAEILPDRPANSHKGTFGQLLSVAGSFGMAGAAFLAAKTALKTGCGLSILSTPKSAIPNLPPEEIIVHGITETKDGTISSAAISEIEKEMEKASALILGPGLSTNAETVKFVQALITRINKPCIVDADALNAIAEMGSKKIPNGKYFVLTPHPKELSRLLGVTVDQIQSDRLAYAVKAAKTFDCMVILKGAHSIIATPDDNAFIVTVGNSGMATAGAGDVLSGIIGGLLAQGIAVDEAAIAGTYIHGRAGDLAANVVGEDGMIASDISEQVPNVLQELRELV